MADIEKVTIHDLATDQNATVNANGRLEVSIEENYSGGVVSSVNSSTALLGIDEVFTGVAEDVTDYSSIFLNVFSDVASAIDGLSCEFSSDGINWDEQHKHTVSANSALDSVHAAHSQYFRVVYINGGTGQSTFRLQTICKLTTVPLLADRVGTDIDDEEAAALVRAVLAAKKPNGNYTNIQSTAGGNLKFSLEEFDSTFNTTPLPVDNITSPRTPFGEIQVAELTPVVQLQSAYNINTRIIEERNNGGASSINNNKFKVSTGAGANQSSSIFSRVAVKYNAGEGGVCRFTAIFTAGVANSTQYIGIGTSGEGYFFGYNGETFGVLRRQGGSPEIRTLTVTVGSTTDEDITITLDGDADTTVTVTNTGNTTLTANEIAAHDYSDLGQGWVAHSMGANVVFESYNSASQTGAYSLSGTAPVAGTFAQSVAGVAPTEAFTAQASWNNDKFDGTGNSGITIDQTKGNVFDIKYQWLGFGPPFYSIEDPSDGDYHLAHLEVYANTNTIPSVDNPTLPLGMIVSNTSNTSDIILESSSMMGGIWGKDVQEGIPNAAVVETTDVGTTETPVLSLHNHTIYQSKINRVRILLDELSVSFDASSANKPAVIRLRLNPTLTGASFSAIDVNTSVIRIDTSASAVSGGNLLFAQSLAEGAAPIINFFKKNLKLNPGETLAVSLEASSGTIDTIMSFGWKELF